MRLRISLFAALVAVLTAAPSRRSPLVMHEKRAADPLDWVQTRRLEADKVLPMRFGLNQQNLHKVEEMLMAVSRPKSPQYGRHYTPEEIVETFAPSAETIATVTNWLTDAGFSRDRLRLSANKGWISVDATTAEVEELLNAEYHVYTDPSGDEQFGCHNYSVPTHVRNHIDLIRPTVQFNHQPSPLALRKRSGGLGMPSARTGPKKSSKAVTITPSLENCDEIITLDCLRALYAVDYTPVATTKNSYGIVEFTPQAFLAGNLDLFFKKFSPSLVGVRPKNVLIDGAVVQTTQQSFDFNRESDLDLEYAMGLVRYFKRTLQVYPSFSCPVSGIDGQFGLVFGTSASSPVVGSLITLINDARLAAGKKSVGFINPSIYSAGFASAFNDIKSGGNQGCGTAGFTATTGWDPVTGVGTPNLTKLLPLFLALP